MQEAPPLKPLLMAELFQEIPPLLPDPTLNLVAGSGITLDGTSTNTLEISSSGGGGAVSITADNTGTTFVDASPPSPITGTGTISADLNATGTTDDTTFLRGDNTFTNVLSSDMSLGGSSIGTQGLLPLHFTSTLLFHEWGFPYQHRSKCLF